MAITQRDEKQELGALGFLMEGLAEGVAIVDRYGIILWANSACAEMFGYPAAKLSGMPVSALDVLHLPLGEDPNFTAAIAEKGRWEGFSSGVRADKATFPISMTVVRLGVGGEESRFGVIYRDLREGMQSLEDLRSVLYLARSAGQSRRHIINSITHEFRTPIAAIIGFADLLKQLPDMPPVGEEFVSAIHTSAERLKSLVESVIEYANAQADRAVVHPERYSVRKRLGTFVKPIETSLKAKNVHWSFRVDPRVPEVIMVDGEKVERILELLLDNAVKFTTTGSVKLFVLPTTAMENALDFRVEDTGIGYDPQMREHIFEPFRQGHEGLNRRYAGIGMGLTLAKQLSHLLGGTLHTTSVEGKGSVFTLTLPLVVASSQLERMPLPIPA